MTQERRKALEDIKSDINELNHRVEDIQTEEQEAYDNIPESLQDSERAQATQASIDFMNDIMMALGDACDHIDSAIE